MKKSVSSVDEKITRNDNEKLRIFILHLLDVSLDEKTKSNLQLLKDKIHFFISN